MKKIFLLLVIIALPIFVSGQTGSVKIYLGSSRLNPKTEDCGKVFAVTRRIPKTKAVAKTALEELFQGTTADEKAKDYNSIFSEASKSILIRLNIKKGAAYINFRESIKELVSGASSNCGSETFFAQMENTLKQFSTVKKVFYAIEGKPEDFYDWVQIGECPKELGKCSGRNFK